MQQLLERALLSASGSTKPQWLFLLLFTKPIQYSQTCTWNVTWHLPAQRQQQYLPMHPQQTDWKHTTAELSCSRLPERSVHFVQDTPKPSSMCLIPGAPMCWPWPRGGWQVPSVAGSQLCWLQKTHWWNAAFMAKAAVKQSRFHFQVSKQSLKLIIMFWRGKTLKISF